MSYAGSPTNSSRRHCDPLRLAYCPLVETAQRVDGAVCASVLTPCSPPRQRPETTCRVGLGVLTVIPFTGSESLQVAASTASMILTQSGGVIQDQELEPVAGRLAAVGTRRDEMAGASIQLAA